jgi:hypothetical protein
MWIIQKKKIINHFFCCCIPSSIESFDTILCVLNALCFFLNRLTNDVCYIFLSCTRFNFKWRLILRGFNRKFLQHHCPLGQFSFSMILKCWGQKTWQIWQSKSSKKFNPWWTWPFAAQTKILRCFLLLWNE